ncbi:unnamed protein product [Rotaria sp. Silwood2]|nr:unnamed protein product [Rotaria sp. Silwood2]CAF3115391.1 unnamed protein product [Rotaria sp. Silwood2]CAF3146399.1 unnamed protein product [Rotaria sp. Silwood2]CAF3279942.1 unnamed protein product [Rotaria sp. Silwood2]CAF4108993.1 unnamed protein product [Rotaria sp. Silwood2]
MQLQEQYQEGSNSITHSPYYGCTVQAVSKAHIAYEGVLDGISINKDRIFLKNVRVKGSILDSSDRDNSVIGHDTLNTVMIDHLTNDMHIYDQVCLNVRDIQELKLIRLPPTFQESKAKLRAIDPCLVDIRLSHSDEHDRMSNESMKEYHQLTPIARHTRRESIESNGGSVMISSSSNESSSSLGYLPIDKNVDDSFNEQIKKFSELSTATHTTSKPVTLLAKKVLPKKIPRNNLRPILTQNHENKFPSAEVNNTNIIKKSSVDNHRKTSPIRVTITSKLNPNATPFYGQQGSVPMIRNSSFTSNERNRFQQNSQPIISSNRSQSIPNEINTINRPVHQQNQHRTYQRFVPPRHMVIKKQLNIQPVPNSNTYSQQQQQQQQQSKHKKSSHGQIPASIHQTSPTVMDQILSTPPMRERLSVPINKHPRQSPVILHSTGSLPYQHRNSGDNSQLQMPLSFGEPIGSHRSQRTVSGTSSGSSLSVDIGPHSIVQLDSTSNALISNEGQYDFEKANEEFRRYLALEELVTRRQSSACSTESHSDDNLNLQPSHTNSYKKGISFFDRISCTATTGTAVAYTEMDEVEKNRETFGDDALLISSDSNDNEWLI